MEQYKKEFIDFMVECQVLKFGEFTLKSGRKSPFFMNAGAYTTGYQLEGSASIMPERSTMPTDWILMFCSDPLTRGSR